jgi:hypothetical protein
MTVSFIVLTTYTDSLKILYLDTFYITLNILCCRLYAHSGSEIASKYSSQAWAWLGDKLDTLQSICGTYSELLPHYAQCLLGPGDTRYFECP